MRWHLSRRLQLDNRTLICIQTVAAAVLKHLVCFPLPLG
jgi:hypothetical protein